MDFWSTIQIFRVIVKKTLANHINVSLYLFCEIFVKQERPFC